MYMYLILRFFNLLLAGLFLASCVAIERNNPDDPGSTDYVPRPSYAVISSSSSNPSSSSVQAGVIEGTPVDYMGEIYKTVVIGTQTWFQRNLNYKVSGSLCYNNQESYCATYGRLYNWDMAMTICPDGWHLPSGEDWNVLMKFAYPACSDYENCNKAGTRLKSTSGWNVASGIPAGTNIYGWTALPGGFSDGVDFGNAEYFGYWWTSDEQSRNNAYVIYMSYWDEFVSWDYYAKTVGGFVSVRCVMD